MLNIQLRHQRIIDSIVTLDHVGPKGQVHIYKTEIAGVGRIYCLYSQNIKFL